MTALTRRCFGMLAGAGVASLAAPSFLRAQGAPHVVIVGGGAGGATAARYIAKDAGEAINVTLIEANPQYTTCFFSNLYLGGFRSFASITHGYDTLAANYGITVVNARATAIDRQARAVRLADGSRVAYDRLIVAPGIDLIYDSVPGYSEDATGIMPHAWKAGPQTQLLKSRLDALEDGQQIVIVPPPNPYRCPPAPYERASVFAHVLKAKGHTGSRIIILDPKPKFSKQALFSEGWEKYYPGMIEWYGPDVHGGIKGVDPAAGTVETDFDTFHGALVNVIPAQRAGRIARDAGLADDSGYCPIDPASMRSMMDENIFVLGDAAIAGDMPKSAFAANSQAKVAAMNVRGDLIESKVFPARYANTCWSLIETDDSVKVGAQYAPTAEKIASTSSFISQTHEASEVRKTNYEESLGWYAGITADIFGA
ncbi:cytochrome-dependent sulfide dehydrogenase (flavoprotein) [Breoghania corrubedonensis]|uniref:Cytochrome-dependent sulfide dehydrogenase (Flavoprotein) n=1 Tax=Breoghania corrubedonensis TaxID=665038 RepID=A0A2T5VI19_9HYPH|nr:NAD(P)/FAD-dependent oxidoreductase [Breoghania corrubedonensis]PTW63358.1 cytochrome-dependent sulfide dehydrogenase (flavoprotein) [Breoghania corrubedonensis]